MKVLTFQVKSNSSVC